METLPQLVADTGAALLVTDFAPLRLGRQWRAGVAAKLQVPFHEVDAHNVVPAWVASGEGSPGIAVGPCGCLGAAGVGAAATAACKIHSVSPLFNRSSTSLSTDKREYAARTIRPKIHAKLPEFLEPFPELAAQARSWN